jgi:hypothetical protein
VLAPPENSPTVTKSVVPARSSDHPDGGDVDPTVHCDGTTDTFNGININDNVNFYAPLALGPGTPNVVYFGTDRLYRSTDQGTTMHVVSQAPIIPFSKNSPQGFVVSAIGISPRSTITSVRLALRPETFSPRRTDPPNWSTSPGRYPRNISLASYSVPLTQTLRTSRSTDMAYLRDTRSGKLPIW